MRLYEAVQLLARRLQVKPGRVQAIAGRLQEAGLVAKCEGSRRFPVNIEEPEIVALLLAVVGEAGIGTARETADTLGKLTTNTGARLDVVVSGLLFGPPRHVGHMVVRHSPAGVSMTLDGQHLVFGAEPPEHGATAAKIVPGTTIAAIAAELRGATTGMGSFGVAFRWEIEQAINSFDDLVDGFERFARQVHRRLCFHHFGFDTPPEAEVSCVIGGWSERRQAYEAYRLVSYAKDSIRIGGVSTKLEPFKASPLPGEIWCSYQPDAMAEFGLAPPASDMDTAEILTRLICASRAGSGCHVDDSRHFNVGGFLQMTSIQKDETHSWIAHRWPEDVTLPLCLNPD